MSGSAKEVKDTIYTGKEPFDKFDRQVSRWAARRGEKVELLGRPRGWLSPGVHPRSLGLVGGALERI